MTSELRGSSFFAHAPRACRTLARLDPSAPVSVIERAEQSLASVAWHDADAVSSWIIRSPFEAVVALAALSDRPRSLVGERIAELFPELAGLAIPTRAATHEHGRDPFVAEQGERPCPLLDHVARSLSFALVPASSLPSPWPSVVAAVLLFGDVAKGGDTAQRADWAKRLGVDGTVHNEDSALILADVVSRRLHRVAPFSDDARWEARARSLCAVTGLVGMLVRGEVSWDALAPWHASLAEDRDARDLLAKVWAIVNHCDTAAVRDGLWTPHLAAEFAAREQSLLSSARVDDLPVCALDERLIRLRRGAEVTPSEVNDAKVALEQLGPAHATLAARLSTCRLWYAEAALGALSLDASVRFLCIVTAIAARHVDTTKAWHLDLLPVVSKLRATSGEPRAYPTRLLEALLAATSNERLSGGEIGASHVDVPLLSFPSRKGSDEAVVVELDLGEEAAALLTLLAIYERKEAAAFHATLKALCDLYGLRKDEFDRVSNEASYLSSMNAARSDKARMVDFCREGVIVEVGPGGGVVLDLIAAQFPTSRVVGLDASSAAVDALERRRVATNARWEITHGDAFKIPSLFGARALSTVVYCSVLHEVFSYVAWREGDAEPARFSLGAVDAIVAASFRALAPGGRIVVRDGVRPPPAIRRMKFLDPTWQDGFDLFTKTYEPRKIPFERIAADEVSLDQADLYEFLTTFTWGPASFPYEIREQRAVLPRAEMVARQIEVCRRADPPYRAYEVPVPADLASYLQPGYPTNIAPHVSIFDESGAVVSMPDVNGVWVIEKQLDEAR